jgi:hypothetical protein
MGHGPKESTSFTIICVSVGFFALLAMQFLALSKSTELGILPNTMNLGIDINHPFVHPLFMFNENDLPISVTGQSIDADATVVRHDSFAMRSTDWKTQTGLLYFNRDKMILTPKVFTKGALVTWDIISATIPDKYIYSAEFNSTLGNHRIHGLAFNITDTGSALLFLIDPVNKAYSFGRWENNQYNPVTDWTSSSAVLEPLITNHLLVKCDQKKAALFINGNFEKTVVLQDSCNRGMLGIFVLSPSYFVAIDNATLAYYK